MGYGLSRTVAFAGAKGDIGQAIFRRSALLSLYYHTRQRRDVPRPVANGSVPTVWWYTVRTLPGECVSRLAVRKSRLRDPSGTRAVHGAAFTPGWRTAHIDSCPARRCQTMVGRRSPMASLSHPTSASPTNLPARPSHFLIFVWLSILRSSSEGRSMPWIVNVILPFRCNTCVDSTSSPSSRSK